MASLRTSTDEVLRLDSVLDVYALLWTLESGGSGGFGGSSFVVLTSYELEFAFLSVMTDISGSFSITFSSLFAQPEVLSEQLPLLFVQFIQFNFREQLQKLERLACY